MKRFCALLALLGLTACAVEPARTPVAATASGLGAADPVGLRLGRSDRALARANLELGTRQADARASEADR